MKLFFKRLRPNAILPARATAGSGGYDVSACMDEAVTLAPGQILRIPTGLAVAPERLDTALMLYARSGLAAKHGICLANGVGLIDSDYRGEIQVALINQGQEPYNILPGMRIAQLVAMPVWLPVVTECDTLPETDRGSGGFGSTGTDT